MGVGPKHLPGGRRQPADQRYGQPGLLLEHLLDGLIPEAGIRRQAAQEIDMCIAQLVIQFRRNQVLELRGDVRVYLSEYDPSQCEQ
jgi:hypothetical protein